MNRKFRRMKHKMVADKSGKSPITGMTLSAEQKAYICKSCSTTMITQDDLETAQENHLKAVRGENDAT